MNRIVILAAAAVALVAGSAGAETVSAIRVSTAGKSAVEVKAEVHQAALKLCREALPGYAYRIEETRACVANAERDTFAQASAGSTVAAR